MEQWDAVDRVRWDERARGRIGEGKGVGWTDESNPWSVRGT